MSKSILNLLKKDTSDIDSGFWREAICGNPAAETWAKYREDCGIKPRKRSLSKYDAVLLFIRCNWKRVCSDMGVRYFRPDIFSIEKMGGEWLQQQYESQGSMSKLAEALEINKIEGRELLWLIEFCLGKRISERTLRRKLQEQGIVYSRSQIYDRLKVKRILKAIA